MNHEVDVLKNLSEHEANSTELPSPPFIVSLIPLLLPVVFIMVSTVVAATGSDNVIVALLGNKIFAFADGRAERLPDRLEIHRL